MVFQEDQTETVSCLWAFLLDYHLASSRSRLW